MIKVSSIEILYDYFARIFFFGINNNYSYTYIEERISSSFFIEELETSSDEFLYQNNVEELIRNLFPSYKDSKYDYNNINSLFLWVGEAYIRLFFKFHKAMAYIFLYIPLKKMIDLFDLYHEMDWSQLYGYFIKIVEEKTLLSILLDNRNLSINKLAQLTNISVNTIKYYYKNDAYLFEAKYSYINAISFVLNVNIRIFLKEINNYTYSGSYEFDKDNIVYRSYLGFYFCSYYSQDLEKRNYQYNKEKQVFESDNHILMVARTKSTSDFGSLYGVNDEIVNVVEDTSKTLNRNIRMHTILVVFEHNAISESAKAYLKLLNYGFERIYIINQSNIICVSNRYWISYISERVNDVLISKAKNATGGDFAI